MAKRKFPYYIVIDIDLEKRKINILDLNSIQEEILDENTGRGTKEFEYVPDTDKHDSKWITVPGASKAEQERIIRWINEMIYENGPDPNKYIVYDHRRHFTDPFHEEYKVNTYREWEESLEEEEVLEAETIEEDEE